MPSRPRVLLPAVIVAASLLPSVAAPVFHEQPLFVSGQNGYHTYRIPAIVRTTAGTLLAFCEGRKFSQSDTGDIDLLVRRSTDNGDTWSPQKVVWDNAANTCGNPSPVVDRVTGVIWLLSTWNLGTDSESMIVNGTSIDTRRVYRMSSADDGLTWSSATEITTTTKQPGWSWYATGPGAGIQLKRGAQAGRLVVACDHIRQDNKAFGSHVIYSDDHGVNWRIGAIAGTTATVRPNENLAVELVAPAPGGGSRIYFNARDHQGPHTRASTFSNDGGITYAPADFIDAPHFVTPVVQGGLARYRGTDEGDPANRILFSCPNAGGRSRMSIWSSTDEAQSWSPPKLVHEAAAAYSDMVRLSDGRMALLYEKGATSPYETITLARFNEAWLDTPPPPAENPGAALWNFEQTPVGQSISTAAGAVLDVHPAGNNLHMTATTAFPVISGAPTFGNGNAISITGNGGTRIFDSATDNRFDFGPGDSFTIEIVCRIPSGSTQIGSLVAKDLAPFSPSWWLRVENGKARFLVADTTAEPNVSSSANINTGQWVHIAAIRDASNPAAKQLRLHVNGILSGTANDTTTGSLANGQAVWIGRYNSGARLLTGDVDFVRITPRALAPADFADAATQFPFMLDYAAWSGGSGFNLSGGPDGDDDGDGLTNFQEYAFGLDPTRASSVAPATAPDRNAGTFSYTRRSRSLTGLSYSYEFSSNLSAWQPFTPSSETSDLGDPVEIITVAVPADLLAEPGLFLRVRAFTP